MASAEVISIGESKAAVIARIRNLDATAWGILWESAAAADAEEGEALERVPHSAPFSLSSPLAGPAGAVSGRRSWAWRDKVKSLGRQWLPRRGSCDDLSGTTTGAVTPAKRAKSFPEKGEHGTERDSRGARSHADRRGAWRSVYEPRWLEEGLGEACGGDERPKSASQSRGELRAREGTAQRTADAVRAEAVAGAGRSARRGSQLQRHNSLPCSCESQKISPALLRRPSAMPGDSSAERSARSVAAGAHDRPTSATSSSQHRRTPSLLVIPPFLPSCLPSPSPVAAPCRTAPSTPPPPTFTPRGDPSSTPSEHSPSCSPAASAGSSGGQWSSAAQRADARAIMESRKGSIERWSPPSSATTDGSPSSGKWRSAERGWCQNILNALSSPRGGR
ncbi:hypothetical protein CLOM_g17380 [Closterium sp. NIES-68]|nr:hypothetical protein CLOM_g17380 [Closterium sp. NIES-68]GJP66644.1 hypothetical protein CLOP_g23557 [Closterium sp. NIES-67]